MRDRLNRIKAHRVDSMQPKNFQQKERSIRLRMVLKRVNHDDVIAPQTRERKGGCPDEMIRYTFS